MGRFMSRGRLQQRLSIYKVVLLMLVGLVIFNEFLSHVFCRFVLWSRLSNRGPPEENVRILFVADPQLIGANENPVYGMISRWDVDRYLSKTFQFAYGMMDADVVIFMGDLMDEGSVATNANYESYYQRFKEVFHTDETTKHIYLAGDNDVGGEAFDVKLPWKVERFIKFFGHEYGLTAVKFVDFLKINIEVGSRFDDETLVTLEKLRSSSSSQHRILLNHMGLLFRHKFDLMPILARLQPSAIFTAHTHKANSYSCSNCRNTDLKELQLYDVSGKVLEGYAAHTVSVNESEPLYEFGVPTCSYRMGVSQMGYGGAVISRDGTIQYTVLWVPSRYFQLYCYIYIPTILFAALLLRIIVVACYTYRKEFFGISMIAHHDDKHPNQKQMKVARQNRNRLAHFVRFCISYAKSELWGP